MRATACLLSVPVLLTLAAAPVLAQNAVTVTTEVEHNSNPTLTPDGESVVRYRVAPQYTHTRESGNTRSVLSLGGVIERSSNVRVSDHRSDPNISYELEVSAPTSTLTLNAALEETSSRTTEFLETGLVTEDATLRTGLAGARWAKQLNEQTGLTLFGGHSQVRYDTPLLVGYSETSAEASIGWQPDEGSRYALMLSGASLNPDNDASNSRRQGLMVSHERQFSQALSGEIGIGRVKTSGGRVGSDTVGTLRLAYEGERLSSDIEWAREISPSGSIGGYTLSQGFRWGLSYPLSESTTLTTSFTRARGLELDGGDGQVVALGMRSELTQFWSFTARLERARATFASGERASGTAVGIGLTYAHPNF